MEVAMPNISIDQIIRNNTVQDLNGFKSQSLATQAKKGEQLVSMMPAIIKAFDFMGDDNVDVSTENETFKNQIGDYDQKWLEESKAKLLKQIDDEKRAILIMSRMPKQMKNLWINDLYWL